METSPMAETPPKIAPGTGEPKTVAQMLGEIVWLLSQSPVHKHLMIADLEWFCMPAILLEQFRVFYGPQSPAAVALWASVSEETEDRLKSGGARLRPDEWRGGDRLWLMELIAPFGAQDEIMKDLSTTVFADKPFKFHHTTPQGERTFAVFDPATGQLAH